jgi:hypothetical protein
MSQPRKIEFTGGFTIVPNNFAPPGPGNYYLNPVYQVANDNGEITIPLHDTNPGNGSLNFNDVDNTNGNAIYINAFDSNGNDNTTYLNDLIGKHTHLTFTQGGYHVTFDCTNQAWQYGGNSGGQYANEFYHDPFYEGAAPGSMNIISTSGQAFNDTDPITISITVI